MPEIDDEELPPWDTTVDAEPAPLAREPRLAYLERPAHLHDDLPDELTGPAASAGYTTRLAELDASPSDPPVCLPPRGSNRSRVSCGIMSIALLLAS